MKLTGRSAAHRVLRGRLGGHRHPTDGLVKKNAPPARKGLQKRVFYTLVRP